jgi:phenylpyruvate tautomerase PptA (4-oxalocrotonate tautomerase family)
MFKSLYGGQRMPRQNCWWMVEKGVKRMKDDLAKHIGDQMNRILGELDSSIHLVRDQCAEDEFLAFRDAVGKVMGALVWNVLNPLYAANPNAKPAGYDDSA